MKKKWIVMVVCELGVLAWLAWPHGHARAQGAPAPEPAEALQARSLAATCSSCHGSPGQAPGAAPGTMPSLSGLSAQQITTAMAGFKAGTRAATLMHQIAKGYSDAQLQLIAAFIAPPVASASAAAPGGQP